MLYKLITKIARSINVYQGISPSLLATMSLSVNIKGKTHLQLINNLKKANLIAQTSNLTAFQALDRQIFTKAKSPYDNRPYPISKGQNMTDVFTHAIIINELSNHWRNHINILDIGTGHGYLSFLISQILKNNQLQGYWITGIDVYDQSINFCNSLKQKIPNSQAINFQAIDLKSYLENNKEKFFDVIIGGYFMEEDISDILCDKLSDKGIGVWPTRSEMGQALFAIDKHKNKKYLIETLFSMPVAKSEVSKYFITDEDKQEYQNSHQSINQIKQQQITVSGVISKKEVQQKLRQQLRLLIQKHKKDGGKVLSLSQMKSIPQIKAKLLQLQKLPKTKLK